ncbi:MAG: hypothetical protein R2867_15460 [Caldilineaceae bacterium]
MTVGAGYTIGDSMTVNGAAVLYFTVQGDSPAVHHTDPRINLANQRIIPTTVTVGDDVVAANANGDPASASTACSPVSTVAPSRVAVPLWTAACRSPMCPLT